MGNEVAIGTMSISPMIGYASIANGIVLARKERELERKEFEEDLAIKIFIDPNKISKCCVQVDHAKSDVERMKNLQDVNTITEICQSLKIVACEIKDHLEDIKTDMEEEKKNIDEQMFQNIEKSSEVKEQIDKKSEEKNELEIELAGLESNVRHLRSIISDLDETIRQKRKKKDDLEKVAIGAGIAAVFTLGATAVVSGVTIAVCVAEMNSAQGDVDKKRRIKQEKERDMKTKKNKISYIETDIDSLNKQKYNLERERKQIQARIKCCGKSIVKIGGGIVNISGAQNQCKKIMEKVDTVKELNDPDLYDEVQDELRELAYEFDNTKEQLNELKEITN
eukprot:14830_1